MTAVQTARSTRRVRFGKLARLNQEPTNATLRWAAPALHRVLRIWTRIEWRGSEHIPAAGPAIIVPNHISSLDPPQVGVYLAYNGRWPHFLARANLFEIPVLGRLLRAAEQIPVHRRSSRARDALVDADAALQRGQVIVIYPEGTLTFDPDEWPMAATAGGPAPRCAGVPVIPIGQWEPTTHSTPNPSVRWLRRSPSSAGRRSIWANSAPRGTTGRSCAAHPYHGLDHHTGGAGPRPDCACGALAPGPAAPGTARPGRAMTRRLAGC